MDRFAGYLLNGTWLGPSSKAISFSSADCYLSAVKCALIRDLAARSVSKHSLCNEKAMKKVRDGMVSGFIQWAVKEQRGLSESHATSTQKSFMARAMVCIWLGTYDCASMFAYFLSLYFLAGRSVEVALVPFRDVSTLCPSKFPNVEEEIPSINLWRGKTQHRQSLSMMPHHDSMLDWYFGMAYSMAMNPNPNEFLFPLFEHKANCSFRCAGDVGTGKVPISEVEGADEQPAADLDDAQQRTAVSLVVRLSTKTKTMSGFQERQRYFGEHWKNGLWITV